MAQDGFKYRKKCCQFPNSMLVQIASFYIYTFCSLFYHRLFCTFLSVFCIYREIFCSDLCSAFIHEKTNNNIYAQKYLLCLNLI